MTIELKVTGDTPEEIIKQVNGLLGMRVSSVEAAPSAATQSPTPAATQSDDDDEQSDDGQEYTLTDLDAEGYPWDERIHSSNQKRTAKGVWQKRKGLDTETAKKVKAELDAKLNGQAEQSSDPAPAPTEQAAPAPAPQIEQPSAPAPAPQTEPVNADVSDPAELRKILPAAMQKMLAVANSIEAGLGVKTMQGIIKAAGAASVPALPDDKLKTVVDFVNSLVSRPEALKAFNDADDNTREAYLNGLM